MTVSTPPSISRTRLAALAAVSLASGLSLLAALAASPSEAVRVGKPGAPLVSTGGVTHVHGNSAELNGTVDPRGEETTYFFQYGPTTAYGSTTPREVVKEDGHVAVGYGRLAVSSTANGLLPGYHYRIVAYNAGSGSYARVGADKVFKSKKHTLKFRLPKTAGPVAYGQSSTLSGSVGGLGGGGVRLTLQASSYPYLSQFSTVGAPVVTSSTGAFSFRLPALTSSTQFRVMTVESRPTVSGIVTVHVVPRIVLRVRRTAVRGIVRLYGTVSPAEKGARISLQVSKPARPGSSEKASERTSRFTTQFTTAVRAGTSRSSRFSIVVRVLRGGTYRAYLQLRKGPLASGASNTVTLQSVEDAHKG